MKRRVGAQDGPRADPASNASQIHVHPREFLEIAGNYGVAVMRVDYVVPGLGSVPKQRGLVQQQVVPAEQLPDATVSARVTHTAHSDWSQQRTAHAAAAEAAGTSAVR